jgi:tetratricopeptide (TPR) repeat protein
MRHPVLLVSILATFMLFVGSVTLSAQDSKDAAALYKEAGQLQNAGKFAEALKKWQQFVKEHANDPAIGLAYQALGTCSLETGAFEPAIESFERALKKLPEGESAANLYWNLALAWQRRADQSKSVDHRKQAMEALRIVLTDKGTPKDRQALAGYYLARAELSLGQKDAARKRFLGLLENSPAKSILPATRLALGTMAEDARDWPEAVKRYADFLQHHPKDATANEVRLGLAEAHFQQKQWKEAEKFFGEVKDAKGNAVDYAHFRWAELAGQRGDLAESAKRWRQFLEQYPKSSYRETALASAGETFDQLKDYPRAIEAWESLLREFPKQPNRGLPIQLGWALLRDGKAERAEPQFKAALDEKLPAEQLGLALWGMARCATGLKKTDEAFARFGDFYKHAEFGPSGDQALYEAVLAALAMREVKTGATWLDKLVERYPKSVWAANGQLHSAKYQAEQGDYEPAWTRSRWVLDSSHADLQGPALYLAGYCALKSRKFKEAIPYYEKLRDQHAKSEHAPVAMYSLGVAWESLGANAKALSAYQDFLKLHPKHALAAQASKRVQLLQGQ